MRCSYEKTTCKLSTNEPVIVRYGYGASTSFIYAVMQGSSFACNNTTFGHDPASGKTKSCYVAKFR